MDLLTKARERLGSDRAVAKYLRLSPGFLSMVRQGERTLPPYQAARLAELLELNPADAYVSALEAQLEKKTEARSFKRWFAKALVSGVIALGVFGHSGTFPTSVKASYLGPDERCGIYNVSIPGGPWRGLIRALQRTMTGLYNTAKAWFWFPRLASPPS